MKDESRPNTLVSYERQGIGSICAITLITVVAILTSRHLFADGSYFFYQILKDPQFASKYSLNREFAIFSTMAPTKIAINWFGIYSIPVLRAIYGATLYGIVLLPIIAFCARTQVHLARAVALLCFFFAALPSYSFIISESHFVHGIFWAILAVIARPVDRLRAFVLLLTLNIMLLRSYTTAFFLLPVIIALLMAKSVFAFRAQGRGRETALTLASAVLFAANCGYQYILFRSTSGGTGVFRNHMSYIVTNPINIWWLVALLASGVVYAAFSRGRSIMAANILGMLLAGGMVAYYYHEPSALRPGYSYALRTLNLFVPVAAGMVLLAIAVVRGRVTPRVEKFAMIFLCLITWVSLAFQSYFSYQWKGFVDLYRSELGNSSLPLMVPLSEARIWKRTGLTKQITHEFCWDWTHVAMSVALRERGSNRVIYTRSQFMPIEPTDLKLSKHFASESTSEL